MGKYCYEYPRPSVATDCVIFGYDEGDLKILLIERGGEPFKGDWALPGGFLQMDEDAETGARRELLEETALYNVFIEQLYTFTDVNRDPRGRVLSITYFALIRLNLYTVEAGDDAKNAQWFSVDNMPPLAFDHPKIVDMALKRLQGKIRYQPLGFELLPEKFTLTELQNLYETVLGIKLDKRNFRRKILKTGLLIQLNEKMKNVSHRAPYYYKFNKNKYEELSKNGFNFEI